MASVLERPTCDGVLCFVSDMNNPSPSMGVGQSHQNPVNHNRPFFYVQPPSQPYFLYQWPLELYGFPGPAVQFGRPCMAPYQFLQYPGYVVPHAPVQPVDYRRMTPHFSTVASFDLRFQHLQQASVRRETACSEAQTDPGDPVQKLVDNLDHLSTSEQPADQGPNAEMVSSTPGVKMSRREEGRPDLDVDPKFDPLCQRMQTDNCEQGAVALPSTLNDSAVYEAESIPGRLEECVLSDVLPLDSSSVLEGSLPEGCGGDGLIGSQNERAEAKDAEDLVDSGCGSHQEKVDKYGTFSEGMELKEMSVCLPEEGKVTVLHATGSAEGAERLVELESVEELPYRILRLPCNRMTTGFGLKNEDPPLYMTPASALLPCQSYFSSLGETYSYYPQVTHERQSVLSPSIDELSSREEMFSTDVEDIDLMSGPVYMGGGRLAETSDAPIHVSGDDELNGACAESCSICLKTCVSCGSSLPEEGIEGKETGHGIYPGRDFTEVLEQGDCDDELGEEDMMGRDDFELQRRMLARTHPCRHLMPSCGQLLSKHKPKKVYCEDHDEMALSQRGQGCVRGQECREVHKSMAKMDRHKGKGQRCSQSRLGNVKPSRKMQQRPRRHEYEDHEEVQFLHCQRGRDSES
ncbi:bucky ball [Chanos chanos]|uniref:Bucky ball n=1 Tax=Chanos chanos TaxID=29144 RepID=A0A6J2VBU8_CHACN|nr:uncharacterized protein LOC115811364 [Chanos chanos]